MTGREHPAVVSQTSGTSAAPGAALPAAGIYLSIPYCRQKCTYCNFASAARPIAELPRYLRALEAEIRNWREWWPAANPASRIPADSIYLGGGTPGLLRPEQLASLLSTVREQFDVQPQAEVTIEVSPENVVAESAAAWAACGINRVSLGVQSLVPKELRAVGRCHTAAVVADAVTALRQNGIENISMDLIAGLPHQTAESWEFSLQAGLELRPTHVSVYMLEVDQDSALGGELLRGGNRYSAAAVPAEELVAEMFGRAAARLVEAGFQHYEISNFALPGYASRHNEKYWTGQPYLGFGVDAHSYDGVRRWGNQDSLTEYLHCIEAGQPPVADSREMDRLDRLEERFFLGLRRRQGVSLRAIREEFGESSSDSFQETIQKYCTAGWLEWEGDCLRLTDRGVLLSNEVFAGFLLERPR